MLQHSTAWSFRDDSSALLNNASQYRLRSWQNKTLDDDDDYDEEEESSENVTRHSRYSSRDVHSETEFLMQPR